MDSTHLKFIYIIQRSIIVPRCLRSKYARFSLVVGIDRSDVVRYMIKEAYVQNQLSRLKELLQTAYIGHEVQYYEQTDSTNTRAATWAEDGAPDGAVVIAEHQTSGRGRQGRVWESDESRNLLFSVILRPALPPAQLGLITVITSLSIAEAIHEYAAPLPVQIKWPNDVLLNQKKCCGVLIETAYSPTPTTRPEVIVGIGINVNQQGFSDDLAHRATSLLLETGRHVDRIELLAHILHRLETYCNVLDEDTHAIFIEKYTKKLAYLNESISLRRHGSEERKTGIIRGISGTGALQFETSSGMELLHAGEVTTSIK